MWTFILLKRDGTKIAEISNATERTITLAINRVSTASFVILASNPVLVNLFAENTRLQVWQGKTLRFYGDVLTPELTSNQDGMSIKVNAVSPAWRLTRRVLGQSKGGTNYTGDKAESSKTMIDELNSAGETSIKTQAGTKSGSTGTYTAGPYKAALTCINDLAHGLDGFDWYISPLEGQEPKIGLYEAKSVYGTTTNVVFEYGYGQKNIRELSFVRDISNLTNKAFHLPEDLEKESILSKEDSTSITANGLFEEVADAFGLVDTTIRNKWLEEVIRVKKNPRFVAGMTLDVQDGTGRVPTFGTDFFLGDFVTARAVVENVTLFNGKVRVYQVTIALDQNGTATVTPTLIEEAE